MILEVIYNHVRQHLCERYGRELEVGTYLADITPIVRDCYTGRYIQFDHYFVIRPNAEHIIIAIRDTTIIVDGPDVINEMQICDLAHPTCFDDLTNNIDEALEHIARLKRGH